ncbi:glycerate kinase [Apibacter raozihei]|uniref:glycerate kinase type-2 family protein n=1 Tax=Apibacter raozihei TaxID=2500547 RepID=UPI000FE42E4A|nr:glycerate kinase [Apibacter raozihei]
MDSKTIVKKIFDSGVKSVLPDHMLTDSVRIKNERMHISDLTINLSDFKHIYIIGAGKASALMAKEIEKKLGSRIYAEHIIVKYGHSCNLQYGQITEAGHPVPDANGFQATQEIVKMLDKAKKEDLIICLLSGGGSALLADCPEGALPEDLVKLNQLLLISGADIHEMNVVRKHLSKVKGGQLAKTAFPATLVSLILSDVIGDSLDIIASGPTSADHSTFSDAWKILEKYNLVQEIPVSLKDYLQKGLAEIVEETPKEGDALFRNVHNFIIGSNTLALKAAYKKCLELGLDAEIITSELQGDAELAAQQIVNQSLEIQKQLLKGERKVLLYGGETTVQVKGKGLGGRNQHLALCATLLLSGKKGITILSAGTDGNDGPTDAAGAIVDYSTVENAGRKNVNINYYKENFDSYHFFKEVGGQVVTGSTLTNVMDLIVVLINAQ